MIYAFDIDGTLTADPTRFGRMMTALRAQGQTVIVITGCISGSVTTPQWRQQQLLDLSPPIVKDTHYDELYVVEGQNTDHVATGKGKLCRERGVAMMIEDTPQWIPFIHGESPKTTCLLIVAVGKE